MGHSTMSSYLIPHLTAVKCYWAIQWLRLKHNPYQITWRFFFYCQWWPSLSGQESKLWGEMEITCFIFRTNLRYWKRCTGKLDAVEIYISPAIRPSGNGFCLLHLQFPEWDGDIFKAKKYWNVTGPPQILILILQWNVQAPSYLDPMGISCRTPSPGHTAAPTT